MSRRLHEIEVERRLQAEEAKDVCARCRRILGAVELEFCGGYCEECFLETDVSWFTTYPNPKRRTIMKTCNHPGCSSTLLVDCIPGFLELPEIEQYVGKLPKADASSYLEEQVEYYCIGHAPSYGYCVSCGFRAETKSSGCCTACDTNGGAAPAPALVEVR